jgi:NAD(P)-dependent dehydrogenase (short-subunit alcohol dehydrogenase family)
MSSRVALVTGASRGIGKQLCIDLAKDGYDVVCVARSSSARPGKLPGTVDETAEQVRAQGRRAMSVGLDVRDETAIQALGDRVYGEWGRCDLLVNNAAVAAPGPALSGSSKHWRLVVDVNLNGPFYMMQVFCPRQSDGGQVINISSAAAVIPEFGRPSYTATKAALEALTRALALEVEGRLSVNCIRLDVPVWSEGFTFNLGEGDYASFEDPVIMSDAVLWLAKQPVSYTGHVLELTKLREQGVVRPVVHVGKR